jgi:hypothetical protein
MHRPVIPDIVPLFGQTDQPLSLIRTSAAVDKHITPSHHLHTPLLPNACALISSLIRFADSASTACRWINSSRAFACASAAASHTESTAFISTSYLRDAGARWLEPRRLCRRAHCRCMRWWTYWVYRSCCIPSTCPQSPRSRAACARGSPGCAFGVRARIA